MLVAAAVCPHPPLLIPEAMGAAGLAAADRAGPATAGDPDSGPGGDDDARISELRAACGAAVAGLATARPDLIAVIGGADQTAEYGASAAGSLRSFGIPFRTGSGAPVLPLSLTVGSWLMRRYLAADPARPPWLLQLQAVQRSTPTAACLRLGAEIAGRAPRVALLVMGDGTARRVLGVHGAADPPAQEYDAEVAAALAEADPGRLARLHASLDSELRVAGRAAWQVLAGAAVGCCLLGQLRFAAAPLDVSYLVASWTMPCRAQ